jgi:hypothetical protein
MPVPRAALLLIAALAGLLSPAHAQRFDPTEAAILALRQAVTFSESGSQHPRLVALRSLRDPSLRPLFEGLLQAEAAPLRLDGFLGLAELDPEGASASRLRALGDPAFRTVVITECLGLNLLKPAAIREILAWTDTGPYDRSLLVAELHRLGESWEPEMLGDAASSNTAEVAGLAAMLMLERKDDAPWQAFLSKVKGLLDQDRVLLLRQLGDAARHYRLAAACEPLLAATTGSGGIDRVAAIAAALKWRPEAGRAAVLELARSDRSLRNLMQCGLLMLAADDAVRAEDFEILRAEGGLPVAMADAGAALRTPGTDAGPALAVLLESANAAASEWAVRQAERLEPAAREALLLKTLDRLQTLERPSMHDKLLAALAVQQLIPLNPAALSERVRGAQGQSDVSEAILAAMCDLGTPESATFARMIRGKLPQKGESMALVTIARTSEGLGAVELRELGRVGGGGGRVDEPIQMQAAWLFLKHSKAAEKSMPRLAPR